MKEFRILRFLDKLRAPLEAAGVQYNELRLILQLKLTMDRRRAPTIGSNFTSSKRQKGSLLGGRTSTTNQAETAEGGSYSGSLVLYLLLGLVLIPFVIMGDHYLFQMSIVLGIVFFMVASSLISDFSAVLLDIRDKPILLSKPLRPVTLNMAKIIHILIYMSQITAAVTLPSLIAGLFAHGIVFFLLYAFGIVLQDLLIVALTALFYFLILRFFDGEKLKDLINYVQIGLTIAITVGYQLLSRLFDFTGMSVEFNPAWWQYFLPPVWFAAPFEVFLNHQHSTVYTIFSLLALWLPIAAILLYIRLMPAFERNLQKLSEQAGKEQKSRFRLSERIGKLICRTSEEAAVFQFASIIMSRERDFKLRVYPTLGFSIIFPFIFLLSGMGGEWGITQLSSGPFYLFIYFAALMVPSVLIMLSYSGSYKGAWIYGVIPFQSRQDIYNGTLKAFLVRLLLPLFLVDAVIFTLIFGVQILSDLAAVLLNFTLYTYVSHLLLGQELPFSRPFTEMSQNSRTVKVMGLIAVLAGFVLVHVAVTFIPSVYGIYGYIILLLAANFICWRRGMTGQNARIPVSKEL